MDPVEDTNNDLPPSLRAPTQAPAQITVRPSDAKPAVPTEDDLPPSVRAEQAAAKAAEPRRTNTTVYDYGDIYKEMRHEAQDQIGAGVKQLQTPTGGDLPKSVWETTKGVGNIGLGALGYVTSPINAAYRTVVGEPLEQ